MATTTYLDFILIAADVASDASGAPTAFTIQVFDSPVGQGEVKETVRAPERLPLLLEALYARQLDVDLPHQIELGEILADLLLPPAARKMFSASLNRLQAGEGLRLRLRLADTLASLPWEFVYLQELRGERTPSSFLALDTRLSILRDLALPFPPDDEPSAPHVRRLLAVMAAPKGLAPLPGLAGEQAELKTGLAAIAGLSAEFLPDFADRTAGFESGQMVEQSSVEHASATSQAVAQALQLQPRTDIFHFSGHAVFQAQPGAAGMGQIGLEDEAGSLAALPADRLGELLRSHGVRLVFLNACQSAQRDPHALWNSLAAAMLKARIPAVVAMQTKIRDSLAAAFSGAFYRALVAGYPLDYAVAVGRSAIRTAPGAGDAIDWGVPVFYQRSGARPVFMPVDDEAARRQAESELPGAPSVQVNQQIGQVFGQVIGEFHGDIDNLSFFESPSAPHPARETDPGSLPAGSAVCPACGAVNPTGARFCEMCSAPLVAAERKCRNCGTVLRAMARFCPQCGQRTD